MKLFLWPLAATSLLGARKDSDLYCSPLSGPWRFKLLYGWPKNMSATRHIAHKKDGHTHLQLLTCPVILKAHTSRYVGSPNALPMQSDWGWGHPKLLSLNAASTPQKQPALKVAFFHCVIDCTLSLVSTFFTFTWTNWNDKVPRSKFECLRYCCLRCVNW